MQMRHYWFSIVVTLLAVSGIGFYYSIGNQSDLPEYKIETIHGNSQEATDILFSGNYLKAMRSETIEVSTLGSRYGNFYRNFRTNLTEVNAGYYGQPEIKQLISKHKSFMRNKENWNGFYQDDELVLYIDISTDKRVLRDSASLVQLYILDIASDQVKSFNKIALNDEIRFVVDVQRVENEVHILFRSYDKDT